MAVWFDLPLLHSRDDCHDHSFAETQQNIPMQILTNVLKESVAVHRTALTQMVVTTALVMMVISLLMMLIVAMVH